MKKLIMVGTRFDTMGGISSVVNVYRSAGLFDRYPIVYLPTHCDGSAVIKLKIMIAALSCFLGMLLTAQVGLLHVHVSSRASFWRKAFFFMAAFLFRVPTILHLHSGAFHLFYANECGPIRKWLIRYIFNHVSHIIVLSTSWKAWVGTICENRNITAIYNPVLVPAEAFPWHQRVSGQTLFFGRLGKNKGSSDLLSAAHMLAPSFPQLHVKFGGDGELEQTSLLATKLGLSEKIHVLGWVRGTEKENHFSNAMIYALPSYNEGLPMSVLEAMAAGLPVLTTPVGGIPEAVSDGVEGFLITPGDVDALADRWSRLLADEGLAKRMGEAARRKIETTFSAEAVLPQLELIYRHLGCVPT